MADAVHAAEKNNPVVEQKHAAKLHPAKVNSSERRKK